MSKEKYGQIALSALAPYPNNARTHSDEQVDMIAKSLQEFGFVNPVLIDEKNMIVAGHGRVMAAKKLGMEKVPYVRVEGLTESQIRAYILADNKLAELAGWDFKLLGLELGELTDIDMTQFGFEEFADDNFGTDFSLPDGDKSEFCQMTFTLHNDQKEEIERAIAEVGECRETFGNTNKNGNALYELIRQWDELKK